MGRNPVRLLFYCNGLYQYDEGVMKEFSLFLFLWLASSLLSAKPLERVSPESQGVGSEDVMAYFDAMANLKWGEAHQIVILRHGKVIGEFSQKPFDTHRQHTLYSVSKTLVGIAVGIAVDRGLLALDDKVVRFFPQKLPDTVSNNLEAMTVRHLLTMTTGVRPDWGMRNSRLDWTSSFLQKTVETPGGRFGYDSMASYMLSAIIQKATRKRLADWLTELVFRPLEIEDAEWEESPEGVNTGGWGLRMSAHSMAKVGQLMLNEGRWGGKQILSANWVREMVKPQVETGGKGAYGYQVWPCAHPSAYRADGAFGQYIIVAPKEDMVFAITQANVGNGEYERGLVWNLLKKAGRLPLVEGDAYERLSRAERSYQVATENNMVAEPSENPLFGKTINLGRNPMEWKSVRIERRGGNLLFRVTTTMGGTYEAKSGRGEWLSVETDVNPPYTIKAKGRFSGLKKKFLLAANHGWEDESTLNVHLLYANWISGFRLTFKTKDGKVELMVKPNTEKKQVWVETY